MYEAAMKTPIQFHLNGEEVATFAESGANLLDVLRESVGDLSVKGGCWQGTCGTCTVLVDGAPRVACVTLAETCGGRAIETVAGLRRGADLHPLQTAFIEGFAAQCGYCTPGMLMAAKALLDRNPAPTREEVVDAIAGNVCRCTGYEPIIEAVLAAARSDNRRRA
jgi:carbon-monoxide dehydrogenase small subunit